MDGTFNKEKSCHGDNKYITYYVGDKGSKIILVAPHGGSLRPDDIPDRNGNNDKYVKVSLLKDLFTMEIALELRN